MSAQEAEPVAWIGPTYQLMPDAIYQAWKQQYPDQGHEHFRPLYAAQPAREAVALTEEQVDVLARPCYSTYGGFDISAFARAVERAAWQANNLTAPKT